MPHTAGGPPHVRRGTREAAQLIAGANVAMAPASLITAANVGMRRASPATTVIMDTVPASPRITDRDTSQVVIIGTAAVISSPAGVVDIITATLHRLPAIMGAVTTDMDSIRHVMPATIIGGTAITVMPRTIADISNTAMPRDITDTDRVPLATEAITALRTM